MTTPQITSSQQSEETLHPDVVAFCALLARIMDRCLREQDPRILALIAGPEMPAIQESEASHAA